MQESAQLNDLARAEIDALKAEGITPTAEDVVLLNALGWAVETPETRQSLARGVPVAVGGSVLWPQTIYAADWVDRVGSKLEVNALLHPLFAERLDTCVLAYAMAHGYSGGGELDLSGEAAARAVMRWSGRLKCTLAELEVAVDSVLAQDAAPELPEDVDGKPMSIGDFSAFLAAACGATPEFWERRCAMSYTFAMLVAVARQNAADGKPVAGDPKIKAERALGFEAEKIRARAKAEQAEQAIQEKPEPTDG